MFIPAIVIVSFTLVQLVIAAVNLISKPGLSSDNLHPDLLISVLIPARNEEKNIGILLNDLISQSCKNIEIIVFDDQSEDLTAEIAAQFSESDRRVRLVRSDRLPEGWLGKNFACHSLGSQAKGDYFLFLDADVRIGKDTIFSVVNYARDFNLGLVSVFPKQIMITPGEKMIVPIMNYILLSLLPLSLVQYSPFPSLAAANGQFMLFDSALYKGNYPHEHLKWCKVEDIGIIRYFKQNNIRVACLTGIDSVQCRMYTGWTGAADGFSKNITAFFGNSFFIALLFWLATTFGFIPVLISLPFNFFIVYIVMILLVRILISLASHQRLMDNLFYLVPQQLSMGVVIIRAFLNKYFFHFQWKGRNIG